MSSSSTRRRSRRMGAFPGQLVEFPAQALAAQAQQAGHELPGTGQFQLTAPFLHAGTVQQPSGHPPGDRDHPLRAGHLVDEQTLPRRQHLQKPAGQPRIPVQQPVHGGPLQPEQTPRPQGHGRSRQRGLVEQGPGSGKAPPRVRCRTYSLPCGPILTSFTSPDKTKGTCRISSPSRKRTSPARISARRPVPSTRPVSLSSSQRPSGLWRRASRRLWGSGGRFPFFWSMRDLHESFAPADTGAGKKPDGKAAPPGPKHRGRPRSRPSPAKES